MESYTLAGFDPSQVQPSNALQLTDPVAAWDAASGQLRATFTLALPGGAVMTSGQIPVIWAGESLRAAGTEYARVFIALSDCLPSRGLSVLSRRIS